MRDPSRAAHKKQSAVMVFLWRPAAVGPRLGLAGASMWAMFAMGCGPATGDPEPDAEPDVAPACDVALIDPGALQVSPSAEAIVLELDVGRAERLSFVFVGAPTGFIVESAPDGVDAELEGEGVPSTLRLVVHASAEPGEVVVRADCDGASGTLGFQVEGARPRWDAFPSWTPGTGGPPGREYFNMWLDDTDPGRLFVFGGFHYEPVQFTVAWDLWSLDLGAEAWTALTPAGEPPHLAGGRLAVGPEAGRGLHYGGLGEEDGSFLLPFSLVEVDWSGADVSFTTLTAASAPATGTYQPAFLYDAPRDRYLAVGGQGAAAIHADVSAYDPSSMTWSSVAVSSLDVPSGRTGFFWVQDRKSVV